jgi:hypothetical protein
MQILKVLLESVLVCLSLRSDLFMKLSVMIEPKRCT